MSALFFPIDGERSIIDEAVGREMRRMTPFQNGFCDLGREECQPVHGELIIFAGILGILVFG
jgi:hypothetical protein